MACRLFGAKPLSEPMLECWNIVNLNDRNKLKWNRKRNSYIFIKENAFENVCEMAAIFSRPQSVNFKVEMFRITRITSKGYGKLLNHLESYSRGEKSKF